ncbi:MAG TPA: transcriptional repressor [Chitinophagaceae bacterium]|nr:transcriptional repressor [Chitinophagaceae bacterium]
MPDANKKILVEKLRDRHIYVTYNRIAILEILYSQKTAVSVADIIHLFRGKLDRISVYRALQLFLSKGLVCSVPTTRGDKRFIFLDERSDIIFNSHESCMYISCLNCRKTQLLRQPAPPLNVIADDIEISRYDIIIEGLCQQCRASIK